MGIKKIVYLSMFTNDEKNKIGVRGTKCICFHTVSQKWMDADVLLYSGYQLQVHKHSEHFQSCQWQKRELPKF